ncbi:MAG: hypothetical protein ABSC24_09250 [Verrucomicrobiota bacterium]|jgi:hypothetical protein
MKSIRSRTQAALLLILSLPGLALAGLSQAGLKVLTWYRRSRFFKSTEENPFKQRSASRPGEFPPITTDVP